MKNDNNRISANDINKFCYCPYQWYYERLYGGKELRAMKTELNKELEIADKLTENFNRGNSHHGFIHFIYRLQRVILILLLFGSIAVAVYMMTKR